MCQRVPGQRRNAPPQRRQALVDGDSFFAALSLRLGLFQALRPRQIHQQQPALQHRRAPRPGSDAVLHDGELQHRVAAAGPGVHGGAVGHPRRFDDAADGQGVFNVPHRHRRLPGQRKAFGELFRSVPTGRHPGAAAGAHHHHLVGHKQHRDAVVQQIKHRFVVHLDGRQRQREPHVPLPPQGMQHRLHTAQKQAPLGVRRHGGGGGVEAPRGAEHGVRFAGPGLAVAKQGGVEPASPHTTPRVSGGTTRRA